LTLNLHTPIFRETSRIAREIVNIIDTAIIRYIFVSVFVRCNCL